MALDLGVTPTGQVEIRVGGRARRFDNLVLDAGWASLLARTGDDDGDMVPRWLSFGTGDGDPHPGQGGLEQRVASSEKQASSVEYGGFVDATTLTAYSEAVVRFDYEAGELTGDNWSELGLAYGEGYSEPYNRALIRDENREPVPLVVLSDEPVTVYVRLRLYMTGWGSTVSLNNLGATGTLTVESAVASETEGIWLKGFPIVSAAMGGETGQQEALDLSVPTCKHYFAVSPSGSLSASRIQYRARDGATHLSVDLDPEIEKPDGLALYLRVRITIVRG